MVEEIPVFLKKVIEHIRFYCSAKTQLSFKACGYGKSRIIQKWFKHFWQSSVAAKRNNNPRTYKALVWMLRAVALAPHSLAVRGIK